MSKLKKTQRQALKQHPLMSDEQLLEFEKAVLQIAAYEKGYRLKAQDLICKVIVPEKLRRNL